MEKKKKSRFSLLEATAFCCMAIGFAVLIYLGVPSLSSGRLTQESEKQINTQVQMPIKVPMVLTPAMLTLENRDEKTPVIILGSQNTVPVRGVITEESVAKISVELLKKSARIPKDETIYLVMYTPGGELDAGKQLISTAKALPQKVKTLTIFSASMGFHIVEALDERLILPSGTLMSHRISGGVAGTIPGSAVTRMNAILRDSTQMDAQIAKRVGMTLDAYQNLIKDEYWVNGQDSVSDRMADRMVLARCASDMLGTEQVDVTTLFGNVKVTYSKCPVITGPLAIDLSALKLFGKQKAEADRFFKLFRTNQKQFVEEYILTNRYKNILP